MKRRPGVERRRRRLATKLYQTEGFVESPEPLIEQQASREENIGTLSNYAGYYFEACALRAAQNIGLYQGEITNAQQMGALAFFEGDPDNGQSIQILSRGSIYLSTKQFSELKQSIKECAEKVVGDCFVEMFSEIIPTGNADAVDFLAKLKSQSSSTSIEFKFQYSQGRNIKYSTLTASSLFGPNILTDYMKNHPSGRYWNHKVPTKQWVQRVRGEGFGNFLKDNYSIKDGDAEILNMFLSKNGIKTSADYGKLNKKLVYGSSFQSGKGRHNAVMVIDMDAVLEKIKSSLSYNLPGKRISLQVLADVHNKRQEIMKASIVKMEPKTFAEKEWTIITYLNQRFLDAAADL